VIARELADRVAAEASFSGAVRIERDGELILAAAAGLRHRGEELPNRPDTRFAIASGSKLFTALAIAALSRDGRLRLDDRLVDRAGVDLPGLDPAITIEQLLRHTSGAPGYVDGDDYEAVWHDRPLHRMRGPRDFLPLFAGREMVHPPGERFVYNDGGYLLLGLVIEAVAGAPFHEVVEAQVLRPAGMADSSYFAADRLPGNCALGYVRDPDDGWRSNVFAIPPRGGGDGGAYATAEDLGRLWRALAGGGLLGAELTARVLDTSTATGLEPPHDRCGLGLWAEGDRQVFVEGWDPGVAMWSGLIRDAGVTVTVLGNTDHELGPLYLDLLALATS
jgi:CubicO group peptidase (beta-lactamase class C family)